MSRPRKKAAKTVAAAAVEPSDVFEWIPRGDGTPVLYKNGQVCGDFEEIKAQKAIRDAAGAS